MPEFLTAEIVKEYRTRVKNLPENGGQDIGERRILRRELQKRCGLTELQAINILNGVHAEDYIAIKEKEYAEDEQTGKEAGKTGMISASLGNWWMKMSTGTS